MKQSHRCPKCRSTDIIPDVRPLDRTDNRTHTAQLFDRFRHILAFAGKADERGQQVISAWARPHPSVIF